MQNATHPTDFLLVQITWPDDSAPAPAQLQTALQTDLLGLQTRGQSLSVLRCAWAEALRCMYLYLGLPQRAELDTADVDAVRTRLVAAFPDATDVQISRLEQVFERQGHSSGERPTAHYVVEMDPEDGWMPEISRWYDEEHMPGLAAVPGCIHAWRMLNHDHGPLSLACYDLASEDTMGSAPWLAVRATGWSSVTRPHFTNTKRTMFEVV